MFDLTHTISILVEMARQDPKNFQTCRTPLDVKIDVMSTHGGVHVQLSKSQNYPDEGLWQQVLDCLPVKANGMPVQPLKMDLLGRYYLIGTLKIDDC